MKNFKIATLALAVLVLFSSCDNDDAVVPVNEEELITTIRVTLVGGGQTITMTSTDLDGDDGPSAPTVVVSGPLTANTTYTGSVAFLNETENPVEDITTEVQEEGVDHQVFYQFAAALGTITYTDLDANGKPIGLTFNYVTGNAGSGTLTVTLKHLPNKSAAGVSTGDITNAGGATDATGVYPFVIN